MRVAINGYGRIGRCIVRALYESDKRDRIDIVAINELSDISSIAHLTRFDSTHGIFIKPVTFDEQHIIIDGDAIHVSNEGDVSRLPWSDLDVDVVLECSGSFTERKTAELHLASGAKKVIFSCPAQPDVDATIVYGLNHHILSADKTIISNASCTTNCISHVIQILNDRFMIKHGVITTIHSMMNDQPVIDAYHNPDLRKSRSSSNSIIPVTTGLAKGIDRIFPELTGRFKAVALRVPTLNVSTMQLTALVAKNTDRNEVNASFQQAARGGLSGILGFSELPLVSCDFNHDPHSAVVDGNQTSVCGENLINVMAWFDNEWGYANRMLDTTLALMSL
ncbi:MAG: type I glyceraldehyde-3-phosphate dehydrogenase [Desulfobulbaceae bacterium]|nr:MAG: type I glyceraldehyde-3-phosphate dehydrogenase [Desulfobulbaceae bacterium]